MSFMDHDILDMGGRWNAILQYSAALGAALQRLDSEDHADEHRRDAFTIEAHTMVCDRIRKLYPGDQQIASGDVDFLENDSMTAGQMAFHFKKRKEAR